MVIFHHSSSTIYQLSSMFKKVLAAALLFAGMAGAAQAQEVFGKGDKALNIGVGLGSTISGTTIPPLTASLDFGVADRLINGNNGSISVGGLLGYTGSYNDYATTHYGIIGARGAFHYQFVDKLDTYAGLLLGYRYARVNWKSDIISGSAGSSEIALGGYLGARYFFTPKVGAFAELGYSIAYANVGVTFKL